MDLKKSSQLIESVFAGGGDMGARMRTFDWSATNLGPVEHWPQSLRACVPIVLGAGHPMLISWGPDYTMLYNDAYGVVVGNKHPGALGRSCRKVLAEAWDFIGPRFDSVYTDGQPISTLTHQMFTFHRKNYLEECYFAFSYSPIPDDNGNIGGVLTNALDMTERVIEDRRGQVLRDLASRTAEARHEEEVWRVSADTLGQNRSSAPFALLYEYRPSEHKAYLTSVSTEVDDALHPIAIDCDGHSLWQFKEALAEDCLVVKLGDRALGLSIPGWPSPPQTATVLPIRLRDHSETTGFLVLGIHPGRAFDDIYRQFVRRIAEQIAIGLASARAYEQERQRAEALAEIDHAKTAFFSNVSHEFRTPLTLMLGPLEEVLAETRERLTPERHEQLITVRRNAFRLLKLVNTLLDFSRIEAKRVQAVYEPTDLASMTSHIASIFRSAMEKGGLRFSVECEPIGEPVYVDHDMWEKIVSNLLSNAFKFTFEGSVTVTLKRSDNGAELQVRDTGVGIPEEHRTRVFERFHRIEGTLARTYEGTGIGLALVQELIRLHGGHVRVESTVGEGSMFIVTIPLGTAHLPAERIQSARSLASTGIATDAYAEEAQRWLPDDWQTADVTMLSRGPSATLEPAASRDMIVIADDNADMRQYLMHLLSSRYEVHAAADGIQALDAARRVRPALILADVMMPQLDGFGLLRAIRDDDAIASIPIILLSARAGEESRVEGLQAGADDYLVKPFAARELLARVEAHIKLASFRRETAEREQRLRMEAELERQRLHASQELLAETSRLYCELQEREAKIRRLVDADVVGICLWNLDGQLLEANDSFLAIVQYNRDDLASGSMRWTDLTPQEWREKDENAMAQLKATATFQPFEKEYVRKDDSRVPVLIGGALFQEGGTEGVAFVLDLTEQKRAEAEIRVLKDQLYRENLALREEVDRTSMFEEIVGSSEALNKVLSRIAKVAPTDSTVFITGETGTGKELIARAVHKRSQRCGRAFVSVNCAALAQTLISSELFGHERGAFTGATQRRLGRFELADGGTIFLDEVGELLPETQVALLRVLQEREFERVGGTQSIRVDARVIAATNRDLRAAVADGKFREDLFYRLNVFPIEVPPLRERKNDILMLVEYFVRRYATRAGKNFSSIDKKTLNLLQAYDWPGNIRELQSVIERSVILSSGQTFTVDESWLSKQPVRIQFRFPSSGPVKGDPRSEREIIEAALLASRGRVAGRSGAAARLGLPPSTLDHRIKALRIDKTQFKFG
jgi:PAS domain S-box-containing protein